MGFFTALAVNIIGGVVIYGTGGLGAGLVAPMLGFGSAGIAAGSTAAAAQAYYGNLAAGSIISQLTSIAMLAPIPRVRYVVANDAGATNAVTKKFQLGTLERRIIEAKSTKSNNTAAKHVVTKNFQSVVRWGKGLEILAEAVYLSVDPYQRMKLGDRFPCEMIGGQIAKVIKSKNSDYPVGTAVMGHFGWRTHTIVNPSNPKSSGQKPYMYALPDLGELPLSLGLGVLGRVGNTAYFGLMEICRPQSGETVVVTGAAGAVGSHVGQIAKIQGCRVIGFAGTDEKCAWLVKELGFDAAANYKTANIAEFLKDNAPGGIDCYFDNVGGALSSTIISKMNEYGRIAVCGAISSYNEVSKDNLKATLIQPFMVGKQLKMEGFQVNRFAERTMQGIKQNLQWVKENKLKYREHVYEGFENAVDAFIGLFSGDNTGKTLVKVN